MPTANISIAPEDGWVLVATLPKTVYLTATPSTGQFYLTNNPTLPAATVQGILVDCDEPFWTNVAMTTENLYARTKTAQADGQKLRLDVLTIV
jgi:hypothetical protein